MTTQTAPASTGANFQGNDKLLFGMIMGVIAFWLFAQTTLNIAPDMEKSLGVDTSVMNIAVSITALFSGMFIVVMGGLADRIGCVKILNLGFILSIIGALLIALAPAGSLAVPVLMLGRIIQGISTACIMPSSLALVKAYWEGAGRQRAISMWSIGSWGGSGLCALFGGLVSQNLGWRYIFFACAAVSLLGYLMCRGTPEFKMESSGKKHKFDWAGVITFMIAMIALQILVTQGGDFGWTSMATIGLLIITFVSIVLFLWFEERADKAFVDFSLFKNATYTGATISNFLVNGVAGMLIISLQLVQLGGNMTAQTAGLLTIGYAIAIIAFIRVGEKLLQRFGARKPMIWGCLITGLSIALLLPTNMMLDQYKIIVIISYILFGIGLAFYATPSTDAALSNLPPEQAGSGSGIYKMASSLGAAFGVAISAAIFTALRADNGSVSWLSDVVPFVGRQDNLAIREAATFALMFNLLMILGAIVSIMLTVPSGKKSS
ncbi:MFS transporter [Actinobacillus seminis]|uniref:MFS transporter n=1 Tax=Actinobacillus seminis TaxID=722 RepID=A0A263HA26_9PAST|nr:MFS transporter [Actinobacillus seminis]OZN24304.1 MFS transporter [Actinobacillus seminis]SUU34188.1 putative transport protein [Actinobacillus seminis]